MPVLSDDAGLRAEGVETFTTSDGLSTYTHHVMKHPGAPAEVSYCTFHDTVGWNKNGFSYVTTHGTVGVEMAESVAAVDIAILGFPSEEYGTPLVAIVEHVNGHTADRMMIYNNTGPITFTHGLEGDYDLRFEVDRRIGDITSARQFVCGVLSATGPRRTYRDDAIAGLVHLASYGRTPKGG